MVTRTTTAVPDGRAGLAYPAIPEAAGFQQPVYLCGLRQNTQDRSNLALQNMGAPGDGPITLRTTLFSGEADDITSRLVGEETLPPGGFHQYSGLLGRLGTPAQGYVKVEKIEGDAPFYAYGVINDNFNSDGSFVFPVTESSLVGTRGQTLPVIIETGSFQSELTVTNFSALEKTVDFSFVADAVATGNDTATFSLALKAGEQRILPDIVEDLRGKEVDGIGPAGRAFVGALFAAPQEGRPERHRDRSPHGLSGRKRRAVQPLLQRGGLRGGVGRKRLGLRAAAERREPQQPGPGQYGGDRRQLHHPGDHDLRRQRRVSAENGERDARSPPMDTGEWDSRGIQPRLRPGQEDRRQQSLCHLRSGQRRGQTRGAQR